MTRKDYRLIADAITETLEDMQSHAARVAGGHQMARTLARYLEATYPNFDRARFLEACGVMS